MVVFAVIPMMLLLLALLLTLRSFNALNVQIQMRYLLLLAASNVQLAAQHVMRVIAHWI